MVYLILFFIELLLLFFLSRVLTKSLFSLFYRITKSQTITIHLLAYLFLPGVIIHELSHALLAGVLFVGVGEMEFMPVVQNSEVKLGSVQVQDTDPFRRAFVGLAPVMVGSVVLILSLFYTFSNAQLPFGLPSFWKWIIELYIIFEIGNTMFSSRKDIEGVFGFLVILGFLAVGVLFLSFYTHSNLFLSLFNTFSQFLSVQIVAVFQKIDTLLFIPLGLDVGISSLARLTSKS